MSNPHIINANDFEGYVARTQIAADTGRGKALNICVKIRGDLTTDTTYEVYDRRAEDGMQLVMITWELRRAIECYNSLG